MEPKSRSERQLRDLARRQGLKVSKPRWRGALWWVMSRDQRKVVVIRNATLAEVEDFVTAGPVTRNTIIEIAEALHDIGHDDDDATWSLRMFIVDAVRALVRERLAGRLSPDAVTKHFAAIRAEIARSRPAQVEAA